MSSAMAQHLANLTGAPVGGFSPNKPWDARDFNHWRTEIKAFIENIRKARLSPRQLLRELKKQTHLSEEQIKDTLQKMKAAGFDDLFPPGQSPSQGENSKG
ncbi:hypothetical protein HYR99_31140 [Candidatus Poribacteria bacterium]|nr:hypothetical protein [Candidatus Poribacteria bacterium]